MRQSTGRLAASCHVPFAARSTIIQKVVSAFNFIALVPDCEFVVWERRRAFILEELLKIWTGALASGIEGVAGFLIALAALQATIRAIVLFFRRGPNLYRMQEPRTENIRLELGRWLALALEFELGADILRTAIAPTWSEIGQLAAIATIRTALNYFLQQEIDREADRRERNTQIPAPRSGRREQPPGAAPENTDYGLY